jgi:UDP-glucose-4-epimerase GalE
LTPRKILVTGGAGYIGAHTAQLLIRQGYDVTVADNLSRGHRHNVDPARLVEIDLADGAGLKRLMEERQFDAVIHFAAYIAVGESTRVPELYFTNNTCGTLSLLTAMIQSGVRRLVFSSTAAVYGLPERVPIVEESPYAPINPYGESKVMVEKMLAWFDQIHSLRSVCLRYFNAAGADPDGRIGEEHDPETHLIPLILRAVKTGKPITVFGRDYDTPDGACVRDYIHVNDLAQAHILAVESLVAGGSSGAFNVGTGHGHSVMEVIGACESVTGASVPYVTGPRREGDPALLVANSDKLQKTFGWRPQFADLRKIVDTAWQFERKR